MKDLLWRAYAIIKALKFRKLSWVMAASLFFGLQPISAQTTDSATLEANVVVTAQYHPQLLSKSVYKITIIDKKKITARAALNVQQVLTNELGIQFTNDQALGTSDISMMGMGGRNIKILLDGVALTDRGDVRESLQQVDVSQLERIEWVAGPMSVMYGSDALAGVINLITRGSGGQAFRMQARVQEESAGREYRPFQKKGVHLQQMSASWNAGSFHATGSILHYDFSGFGADAWGRAASWKPKEQWMPSIRVGYKKKRFQVYYRNDFLKEWILSKAPINTETLKASQQHFITQKMAHQIHAGYHWNDKVSWNHVMGFTQYARNTETQMVDYAKHTQAYTKGLGEQDKSRFTSLNIRSTWQYLYSNTIHLQPGIEINHEKANGARIAGQPGIENYAAFLSVDFKPRHWFNLRPGIRITKNSLFNAPPVMPSINLRLGFNDQWTFRASMSRGYRAPALRELYFDFQDANHNIKGNPNLKAETSQNYQANIDFRKANLGPLTWTTELGWFYNRFANLINLAANPNIPQQFISLNIDRYKTMGFQWDHRLLGEKYQFSLGLLVLGQFNRLHDQPQIMQPPRMWNWSPEVNAELLYPIKRTQTNISLFYKYTGGRKAFVAQANNEGKLEAISATTSAYSNGDVSIQQQILPGLKATVGGRNLFNVTSLQQSAAGMGSVHGGGGEIAYSYGRSWFVGLQFQFLKP